MSHQGSAAWESVRNHAHRLRALHLREMFAHHPGRADTFTAEACGLFIDYSKNRIDDAAMAALNDLANKTGLSEWIERMFQGERVNSTEDRAALHVALRHQGKGAFPDSGDVMPEVRGVLARLAGFCAAVHEGRWTGFDGARITDVVNIGIGGSDLGPLMVCDALSDHAKTGLRTHFVSNLDPTHLAWTVKGLAPATTLFLIASKTFGTQETLANARSARSWIVEAGGESAVAQHFVALSSNHQRVVEFGIDPANMFEFWDWVGGRYSLWSAIGLPIALGLGFDQFEALHRGAAHMDEHFRSTPFEANLPVILGLLQVWYCDGFAAQTRAILPYDFALRFLPNYLQQLEMESLGKRVTRDGNPLGRDSCPIIWGGPGNNGQHAFYQLLHQGTVLVPCDFIVPARFQRTAEGHDEGVIANALAQMEALMRGRTELEARAELVARGERARAAELAPHLTMPGNQPSTAIVYAQLNPEVLGALIALYEHKVFVQAVLWGMNPFDQYGVELGKQMAGVIESDLTTAAEPAPHDASTQALIRRLRHMRDASESGSHR